MIRRVLLMLLLAIYATTPAVAAACAAACAVPAESAGVAEVMDCHGSTFGQPDDSGDTHSDKGDGTDGDSLMLAACAFAASAAAVASPIHVSAAVSAEPASHTPHSPVSLSTPPPGEPPRG